MDVMLRDGGDWTIELFKQFFAKFEVVQSQRMPSFLTFASGTKAVVAALNPEKALVRDYTTSIFAKFRLKLYWTINRFDTRCVTDNPADIFVKHDRALKCLRAS